MMCTRARERGAQRGAPGQSCCSVEKTFERAVAKDVEAKKNAKTHNFAIFRNSSFGERILPSQLRARDRGSAVHKRSVESLWCNKF